MGQLDMVEKLLEDYEDVFADIVNVLLFKGKRIVKEEDLIPAEMDSQYKAMDGRLHEQERDVAKYWKKGEIRIAVFGLENQTKPDADMPMRVFNYEGTAYRSQLMKKSEERFPVITLVLYFGTSRWKKPLDLHHAIEIPEELKPYVNNFKINLFEIAYLTDKQIGMFQSDFGIVAEYFTLIRKKKNPRDFMSEKKIRHVDEMLKMMTALTGDHRFLDSITEMDRKGGSKVDVTMSKVLDQIENKGRQEGRDETYITVYLNCRRRGMSMEDTSNLIGIDEETAKIAEEKFQKEK